VNSSSKNRDLIVTGGRCLIHGLLHGRYYRFQISEQALAEQAEFSFAQAKSKDGLRSRQGSRRHLPRKSPIYSETRSGASTDGRKALAQALKALGEGDVLIVTRLDRLARSTRDLLNVLDTISKAGAGSGASPIPGPIRLRPMAS
jgi:DNA invertase Pin-like site-specific DNA recombinase